MRIRKGDEVMFSYVPPKIPPTSLPPSGRVSGRSRVLRVLRQVESAVVEVWDGQNGRCEMEIPLSKLHKVTKSLRPKHKNKRRRPQN